MSNIDKQALRVAAEKATPGPWLWINTGSYFSFLVPQSNQDPHNCIIDDGSSWGEYGETINPESPDGVFIAAANPAAVLALLDELEAAEKRIAELESSTLTVKLPKHCGRDIAAFRVDPNEGSSWLTFRCEEDLRKNGLIGANDSVVPLSVISQETPKRGEVIVTVSGITGSGKSAIAGEIEIAMKAIGVPVQWANGDAEKRMTGADWLTAIELYKPSVRIIEVNVPRAAAAGKGE